VAEPGSSGTHASRRLWQVRGRARRDATLATWSEKTHPVIKRDVNVSEREEMGLLESDQSDPSGSKSHAFQQDHAATCRLVRSRCLRWALGGPPDLHIGQKL
jgi:hypothetical protein